MKDKFELLEASFDQINRFLEITQDSEKLHLKEKVKEELNVGDERFYKIRNTCRRLGLVDYDGNLSASGCLMLKSKNRRDFLASLLYKSDDKFTIIKAINRACENLSLPYGSYVSLGEVTKQLKQFKELESLHRLWATLNVLYKSVALVELKKHLSQVQVKLNPDRVKSIAEKLPWNRADDISNIEFFNALLRDYEKLSKELSTKYIPISELGRKTGFELKLAKEEFEKKLLDLPPIYRGKKIVKISPRGPRGIPAPNGKWYKYVIITSA